MYAVLYNIFMEHFYESYKGILWKMLHIAMIAPFRDFQRIVFIYFFDRKDSVGEMEWGYIFTWHLASSIQLVWIIRSIIMQAIIWEIRNKGAVS